MTEGAPADRDRLRTALADLEVPPDTAEIVALLERSGSRVYAESLAEQYHAVTRDLLADAPLSAWGGEALGALAAFTARRTV
jgi:geranylgeranyl pyrophosphate synthase